MKTIFHILLSELFVFSIYGMANYNDYAIKQPRTYNNFDNLFQEENKYDSNLIKTRSIHYENNACQLNIECSGKILTS